jgi:Flp pilus assembly protein TadG
MKELQQDAYQTMNDSGQSLTEFALVLVFLLVILAGVVDLGRAFFSYIIIRDAAQEGALYGSIAPKDDLNVFQANVATRVQQAFSDPSNPTQLPLNLSAMNVQTDIVGSPCAAPGNGVRVTVDYTVPITMPFLGAVLGSQQLEMETVVEDSILSPICP